MKIFLRRVLPVGVFIILIYLLFQWGPAQRLFHNVEDLGIDAGAYFYTETEVSYKGEAYIRESLAFSHAETGGELAAAVVIGITLFGVILWLGYKFALKD